MRIRFLKNDPRAGMVAEVQESTANRQIASGSAEKVSVQTEGRPPTLSAEVAAVVKAAVAAKQSPSKQAAKKAK